MSFFFADVLINANFPKQIHFEMSEELVISVSVETELIVWISRSLSLVITFFGELWRTCSEYGIPFPINFGNKDFSHMEMKERVVYHWLVIYEAVFCYHVRYGTNESNGFAYNICVKDVKAQDVVLHRIFHALVYNHNLFLKNEKGAYDIEAESLSVYLTVFLDLIQFARKKSFFAEQDFILDVMISRIQIHLERLSESNVRPYLFLERSTTFNYFVNPGRVGLYKLRNEKFQGTKFSVSEDLQHLRYLLCVSLKKYEKKVGIKILLANMLQDFENFKELRERYDAFISANAPVGGASTIQPAPPAPLDPAIFAPASAIGSTSTSASASSSAPGSPHGSTSSTISPSVPPVSKGRLTATSSTSASSKKTTSGMFFLLSVFLIFSDR